MWISTSRVRRIPACDHYYESSNEGDVNLKCMYVCAYVAVNEGDIMIKCMFVCACETLLSDVMLWRCRLEHLGVDVLQQVSSWWGRESVVRGVSWRWKGVVGGDIPLWSCFQRCCGMEQVPCHRSWLRAVL